MSEYKIRPFQSLADARPQYDLWLRATETLPRPWRSCLRNVESQLEHGARFPQCRLYAERADGALAGYIGTHPPFEWLAKDHGPPSQSLGWAIPFGFPWTHPLDETLERVLYDEMIRVTPQLYADSPRDIYIQRFRESWARHLSFLTDRGWRLHDRVPLLGRPIDEAPDPPRDLVAVERPDLHLVSVLAAADDTATEKPSTADLEQRYDGGWIVHDTFWRVGERGAFALEQRGVWCAVTLLHALPDAWDDTLSAAAAQAAALGARELYFTVEGHEHQRRAALERRGFGEVDAGVYYVRDAD